GVESPRRLAPGRFDVHEVLAASCAPPPEPELEQPAARPIARPATTARTTCRTPPPPRRGLFAALLPQTFFPQTPSPGDLGVPRRPHRAAVLRPGHADGLAGLDGELLHAVWLAADGHLEEQPRRALVGGRPRALEVVLIELSLHGLAVRAIVQRQGAGAEARHRPREAVLVRPGRAAARQQQHRRPDPVEERLRSPHALPPRSLRACTG